MTKTRREFAPEFTREAVALLASSGRPLMRVATELGIEPSMLRGWRAVMRGGSPRSGRRRLTRRRCHRRPTGRGDRAADCQTQKLLAL